MKYVAEDGVKVIIDDDIIIGTIKGSATFSIGKTCIKGIHSQSKTNIIGNQLYKDNDLEDNHFLGGPKGGFIYDPDYYDTVIGIKE